MEDITSHGVQHEIQITLTITKFSVLQTCEVHEVRSGNGAEVKESDVPARLAGNMRRQGERRITLSAKRDSSPVLVRPGTPETTHECEGCEDNVLRERLYLQHQ